MNHCVPEFNMDEDHSLPSSSGLPKQKNMQENEIMELLWHNGQVVVQSQNPRLLRKSSNHQPSHPSGAPPPPGSDSTNQLFMQEDEMISWLQYPLEETSFDRDLTDLFYHPPGPPQQPIAHSHHQAPSTSAPPMEVNYAHSSRMNSQFPNSGPSTSSIYIDPREVTGVDSSDTPAMGKKSKLSLPRRHAVEVSGGGNRGTSTAGGEGGCMSVSVSRDGETCELTLTSSPGGSGASASATATADVITLPPEGGRKRKGREPVDDAITDYQSEKDVESYDAKKQTRGVNAKRSRAAEVHNLSERRRRDRINEKMKALQELIPRCNKTDKASMLDEAIEYLKSLQMQVQMMSMGCGMVPVMFPGVQQYMPSMGMGMGMGLGMGMEMGMTRPMMPFPSILSGSGLPTLGATSHMNPRFPHQTFPMPTIPGLDPSRTQPGSNQADATVNPLGMSGHNMARIPNVANPYQQCIGIQHIPMQTPTKNHPNSQPSTSKPSRSREDGDTEKH